MNYQEKPITILKLKQTLLGLLNKEKIDAPLLTVELILAYVLKKEHVYLATYPDILVSESVILQAHELVYRRLQHEPLAYILGTKEFYGLSFKVNRHTLIPRPETELMVDLVLSYFKTKEKGIFADLGTGSGCIGLALLSEKEKWQGICLDISWQALQVAYENSLINKIMAQQILFLQASFGFFNFLPNSFDLIVSNPPYISSSDYTVLMPEVKSFEPYSALVASKNGLADIIQIERVGQYSLRSKGLAIIEIGFEQGEFVLDIFENQKGMWQQLKIVKDLAGLDRFVYAVKK